MSKRRKEASQRPHFTAVEFVGGPSDGVRFSGFMEGFKPGDVSGRTRRVYSIDGSKSLYTPRVVPENGTLFLDYVGDEDQQCVTRNKAKEPVDSSNHVYPAAFLLGLLDGIDIPPSNDQVEHGNVTIPIRDGWQVVVFYDCGGLDYIDSFITPEGQVVDFWEWPDSEDREALINWS